jgi:uroporphyrinogen-III synthase
MSVGETRQRKTLIVTRPRAAAEATVAALTRAGIHAVAMPLLDVSAVDPANDHTLAASLAELVKRRASAGVHGIIFVSVNAAAYGVPLLLSHGLIDSGIPCYAVGRATRAKLESLGMVNVITPQDGEDSEALLALPQLSAPNGETIALVKGWSEAGGRPLIAATLQDRGATVYEVVCYARQEVILRQDQLEELQHAIANGAAVLVGSVETMSSLATNLPGGANTLSTITRLLVPHPRVAAAAAALGIKNAEVVSLEDNSLIAYLRQ